MMKCKIIIKYSPSLPTSCITILSPATAHLTSNAKLSSRTSQLSLDCKQYSPYQLLIHKYYKNLIIHYVFISISPLYFNTIYNNIMYIYV